MNKAKTLRIKRAQLLKGYQSVFSKFLFELLHSFLQVNCNNSRTNVTQEIFISKVMFSSRRKMAFF